MTRFASGALLAASVLFTGLSASAATVTLTAAPAVSAPDYLLDFDHTGLVSPGAYGVSASGDYIVTSGTTGTAATPLGDPSRYISVPNASSNGAATLSFDFGSREVKDLSLQWGSIDGYNSFKLLGAGGVAFQTIDGGDYPPHNGDQFSPSSTGFLNIALTPGETLTGIELISTSYALESDNYAFNLTSAAPEPDAWALMIIGVGVAGSALRLGRRRGWGAAAA